jgi:hypothetical protein
VKKVIPIGITGEYLSAFNAANHDMVDGTFGIDA